MIYLILTAFLTSCCCAKAHTLVRKWLRRVHSEQSGTTISAVCTYYHKILTIRLQRGLSPFKKQQQQALQSKAKTFSRVLAISTIREGRKDDNVTSHCETPITPSPCELQYRLVCVSTQVPDPLEYWTSRFLCDTARCQTVWTWKGRAEHVLGLLFGMGQMYHILPPAAPLSPEQTLSHVSCCTSSKFTQKCLKLLLRKTQINKTINTNK